MLANDDELSPHRDPFLKNFLEERTASDRRQRRGPQRGTAVLNRVRESELADDNVLYKLFENHLTALPTVERPQTRHKRAGSSANGKAALSRNSWAGGKNWPRLNLNPSTVS